MKLGRWLAATLLAASAGCGAAVPPAAPEASGADRPLPAVMATGNAMAISYSGYRAGQHPDRGDGAVNPSEQQLLEDLGLLVEHGFGLIRVYDSRESTRTTLELIRRHQLPLKVLLGIWLDAEFSNHLRCKWLEEPIPDEELARNVLRNADEVRRGIELANQFEDIVVAVNVGNEALVDWSDHTVPLEKVIGYVRQVRAAVRQPVTVADSYDWWVVHGAPLASEVDFVGVHSYPVFEGQTIEGALPYMIKSIEQVRAAFPGKALAILEAGWPTVASEFPDQASEANQARHYAELREWGSASATTIFYFEAFDEPWKGNENDPLSVEKHWGLFNVDRTPKAAMQ